MKTLTVIDAFAGYAKGAVITDPDTVAALLDSEQAAFVVATDAAEPPAAD